MIIRKGWTKNYWQVIWQVLFQLSLFFININAQEIHELHTVKCFINEMYISLYSTVYIMYIGAHNCFSFTEKGSTKALESRMFTILTMDCGTWRRISNIPVWEKCKMVTSDRAACLPFTPNGLEQQTTKLKALKWTSASMYK